MIRNFYNASGDREIVYPDQPSLGWLLLSGLGNALAGIVVVGILAGRLGLSIHGEALLVAGFLAMLPQLWQLIRRHWEWRPAELVAMLISTATIGGVGLALAWPSLLPLGFSVDAVHHAQLVNWIADHGALPPASRDIQGLLGEMSVYPVGMVLVVLAAADLVRQPPLETMYPTAAVLGGLIAGLIVLLSSAASLADEGRRTKDQSSGRQPSSFVLRPSSTLRSLFRQLPRLLALLTGPLVLLVYRTYLLEAYTDHSYYTMVLGVFLVLLAGAWLIVPAKPSWWQFGLALAALAGTYPLWTPLPAAGAAILLLADRRGAAARPYLIWLVRAGALAFGPALALGLIDVLPRLRVGQTVLAHQGLVTLPTLPSLAPLIIAVLAAVLFVHARGARRLVGFAGLGLALALALAGAAWLGLAASYHSYKLLFVLMPLAATILGAACARLAHQPSRGKAAVLVAGALVLGLAGPYQAAPAPHAQLLDPGMLAAARWLRANDPRAAAQAMAINVPTGPTAYWVQVGLLGQRRDKIEPNLNVILSARPTVESWLVDTRLPAIAIGPAPSQPLPGLEVAAQFGTYAVLRRAERIDPAELNPLTIHYRSYFEDARIKTAIELQRPLPGPLPVLEVAVYHAGRRINSFALRPDQDRLRPQYLGVDLLPEALGGEGYINTSAYPHFAPLAAPPTGAISLTLRLSIGGNKLDERLLATAQRTDAGAFVQFEPNSGELVYLRRAGGTAHLRASDLDFDGALRLSGWQVPARISSGGPIAVDLRWQALQSLDRSLFPELQLRDSAGRTVATSLAAPQDGFYPTWRWQPGESVIEQRNLELPPTLSPGTYRLVVQVHDFEAQRMLNTIQNGGALADLGEIVIEGSQLAQQ